MTNCWFCGTEMRWCDDSTFENIGLEGNGIVATLSCPKCNASADFYKEINKEG